MNFYCESCKRLCATKKECLCGNQALREVTARDYCFLIVADELHSEMLNDCFISNGIDSVLKPFGDGYRNALGLPLGNYIIYVLYSQYEQAKNLVEFFNQDSTNDLKQDLIKHREFWNVSKRMHKRLCQKLKIKDANDVFDAVAKLVEKSNSISDDGAISSCIKGGHYISVNTDDFKVFFNSVTYEIFI